MISPHFSEGTVYNRIRHSLGAICKASGERGPEV